MTQVLSVMMNSGTCAGAIGKGLISAIVLRGKWSSGVAQGPIGRACLGEESGARRNYVLMTLFEHLDPAISEDPDIFRAWCIVNAIQMVAVMSSTESGT